MNDNLTNLERLCELYDLSKRNGFADTYVDEIKLFKVSSNDELAPLLYKKGFSFIGQGKKIAYINDIKFEQGHSDYLMITSPQPVECKTYIIGSDPLVGIYINLDMNRLHKIVRDFAQIENTNKLIKEVSFSIACINRTDIIQEVYLKILTILEYKIESKMLSNGLLDELYFRILQSDNGFMLKQLCEENSNVSKISRVTEYIINNIDEKLSLDDMARKADMSINNFHKLFKQMLNDTPIQYIKKIRLTQAKQLILFNNMKAVEAANAVGYENANQFGREFKRYFGIPPSKI
jgi:AraC-like DNA-binding protein